MSMKERATRGRMSQKSRIDPIRRQRRGDGQIASGNALRQTQKIRTHTFLLTGK